MGRAKEIELPIENAFKATVDSITATISEKKLVNPVDLKIEFTEISINKKSLLVIGKRNQKQMSISIATRIIPE